MLETLTSVNGAGHFTGKQVKGKLGKLGNYVLQSGGDLVATWEQEVKLVVFMQNLGN